MPVRVTWATLAHVYNLRSERCFRGLEAAFWGACDRFGMRINHFAVQRRRIELIVEADDEDCLARGMQGLGVRIAKALNRVMGTRGKVLADRYEARVLRTPDEARTAIREVLGAHVKQLGSAQMVDRYSSAKYVIEPGPVKPPSTPLLKKAWAR